MKMEEEEDNGRGSEKLWLLWLGEMEELVVIRVLMEE